MIELSILGSTKLNKEDGNLDHSFVTGPKRLALLSYLLMVRPRGFNRRDKLVAVFWPDLGQQSARNALSNMLYHIREVLGKDVVINRGTQEVSIDTGKIWCDALAFEEACEIGSYREGLDLYRDDLLQGLHVSDVSNEFQSWLDSERERLRMMAAEASWALAEEAEQADRPTSARIWAQKAVAHTGLSEEAYKRLMALLDRTGDQAAAIKVFREFSERYKEEWDMAPGQELVQLAQKIRNRATSAEKEKEKTAQIHTRSIAVLPFETLGADKPSQFTIGLHGDMITRLSNISDIQVISRTSVRQYADARKTVREIGHELNATWLLEGEVQEHGGEVRLNIRLIYARDDLQIWSRDYRRELTTENLFNIQTEITIEVADALKVELTPEEQRRLERKPTQNLAAYRLYMQGWTWLEQRTEKGMYRALEHFDQALGQDPDFALAMTGRALALLGLFGYGFSAADEVLPEAEELIVQVLDTDPKLAEAHAALGLLHTSRNQGPEAVKALKKAIELRPGYANAHNKLSWIYQLLGKRHKALESAKNAVEVDPYSPEAVINLSFSLLINGKKKRALSNVQRVRALQPTWTTAPFYEGIIRYHLGEYRQSKELLQDITVAWAGEGPKAVKALAELQMGQKASVFEHLNYIRDMGDYFATGLILAALGKKEQSVSAFEHIEHWDAWPTLSLHHLFPEQIDILKNELGFETVMAKMRQYWGIDEVTQEI